MRLIVDDSAAFTQAAGIGRYARHVVPAALRHLDGLVDLSVTLFWAPADDGAGSFGRETLALMPPDLAVRVRRSPVSRRRLDQLWHRAGVRVSTPLVGRGNLLYCPDFLAPPVAGMPTIVTVHDLAFLVCPERALKRLVEFLKPAVARQVSNAAAVAVVSETSKRDLVERLGVAPERVTVVPNGVEKRFFAALPPSPEQRRRLDLPADYLLMVGTLEPRKNHSGAFAALTAAGPDVDLPLLVVGRKGWDVDPIYEAARGLVEQKRVRFLRFVPDDLLPSLYAGAAALVYPSWYEGFGLPVVEALAAGAAVVVSDAPALREVGGDVVEVAAAGDVAGLAEAIRRAVGAARLAPERARRQARAACYDWDTAGKELASLIRSFKR